MLYLVGLGLGDLKDVSIKGLDVIKSADRVYLEAYTSIFISNKEDLEEFYGREVILADRDLVEQDSDQILELANEKNVAFLVVGDPLGATTHTDLILRAIEKDIRYEVIHNASILTAVGCCGLQLYNFGETVSIVLWTNDWKPESFFDKILLNRKNGLHTLCLLDIKMKEQSVENMMRGRKIFEPPRFLTCSQSLLQIMEVIERRKGCGEDTGSLDKSTICVGLARVGWKTQNIKSGTMKTLSTIDFGPPIHSLIIPGNMHFLEIEMIKQFAVDKTEFAALEAKS